MLLETNFFHFPNEINAEVCNIPQIKSFYYYFVWIVLSTVRKLAIVLRNYDMFHEK